MVLCLKARESRSPPGLPVLEAVVRFQSSVFRDAGSTVVGFASPKCRRLNGEVLVCVCAGDDCAAWSRSSAPSPPRTGDWEPTTDSWPLDRSLSGDQNRLASWVAPLPHPACQRDGLSRPSGRTRLEVSFPLRCFQRLSCPYLATRPCHWRDNRCTRGMSIPVLSY